MSTETLVCFDSCFTSKAWESACTQEGLRKCLVAVGLEGGF